MAQVHSVRHKLAYQNYHYCHLFVILLIQNRKQADKGIVSGVYLQDQKEILMIVPYNFNDDSEVANLRKDNDIIDLEEELRRIKNEFDLTVISFLNLCSKVIFLYQVCYYNGYQNAANEVQNDFQQYSLIEFVYQFVVFQVC